MKQEIAIGHDDFETVRNEHFFYIDKTYFIKEWWERGDKSTLITRPRRFGKTLNMSMLNCFFSNKYKGRADLFYGLSISRDEKMMELQGTYPVIFISFANVKGSTFKDSYGQICSIIDEIYNEYYFLLKTDALNRKEKEHFEKIGREMDSTYARDSLQKLSGYLSRYYGKNVIILLDEYDTPMQEAYLSGYWDEMASFMRGLFNTTFKTNPCLYRAVMTGITRISKESMFSDLNNLNVVTSTSNEYANVFGFTENEVFLALDEQGMGDKKEDVKKWYDGFKIGNVSDIYNPWSILNFLSKKKLDAYWANTSSNRLVGKLIQEGEPEIKAAMEILMSGGTFKTRLDEQIVFDQLGEGTEAVWSLFLSTGYLKAISHVQQEDGEYLYELAIPNMETQVMFRGIVRKWFNQNTTVYQGFIKAFLSGEIEEMNIYMNRVVLSTFSSFDSGSHPSGESEPERFYHGFVLGLLVELNDRYLLTSNRESGLGRYDVVIEPKDIEKGEKYAYVLEFKVMNPKKEKCLEETVQNALSQIEEKKYDMGLLDRGIPKERIIHYGFAFRAKEVLIGKARTADDTIIYMEN